MRFFRLWSAATVSELGNAVTDLALPLTAILILHATPLQVGVLGAMRAVPYIVVGLAAGVYVDRSRPLAVMVLTDLVSAVTLAAVPIAFVTGHLSLPLLYVMAFLAAGLSVLFGVGQSAAVHGLVPNRDLITANSRLAVSTSLSGIAGQGLGGFLVAALTAPLAILVDAASFLLSAVLLATIRRRETEATKAPRGRIVDDVMEGLHFIVSRPVLRGLAVTLAILNLFAAMFEAVYFLYMLRELNFPPAVVGLVRAAAAAGGLAGAASAPWLGRRFGIGMVIMMGAAPVGLVLIPLAPMDHALPWLVCGEFIGMFGALAFNSTQLGLRQSLTPARLQGRMTASMRFLILVPAPLGAIAGGALGGWIGLHATLWIGAVGALLAVLPIVAGGIHRVTAVAPGAAEPTW